MAYDLWLSKNPLQITRNRLLKRTTAPAMEPLTLAETKLYLRIDASDEDALIGDLITAARMAAEAWLKKSLISQTWKLAVDDGVASSTFLPMGPVSSISSVTIYNQDGTSQAITASTYWLNAAQNMLMMGGSLTGFRIEITYIAGYGDATTVPKPIKQGMLAHIADLYELRGEAVESVFSTQTAQLYAPFREVCI